MFVRIISYFLVITILFLALFFIFAQQPKPHYLNTNTISYCDPSGSAYFLNHHEVLRNDHNKIIIMGPSNALKSFDVDYLNNKYPDFQFHNISINSSNMSQLSLTLDVLKALHEEKKLNVDYIVLGISWGVFIDKKLRWPSGQTPLEQELSKYNYFTYNGDKLTHNYSAETEHNLSVFSEPFRCLTGSVRTAINNTKNAFKDVTGKKTIHVAKQKLQMWEQVFPAKKESFIHELQLLNTFLKDVKQMNITPIIIDMPASEHVYKYSNLDAIYSDLIENFAASNKQEYVNWRNHSNNLELPDLIHPTKKDAIYLSDFLIDEIKRKVEEK